MVLRSLAWMVGGAQGSGINLGAEVFAKALCRSGLHVFGNIEYHSNIKGKHSYYRLHISPDPVRSHIEAVDVLVALDEETLFGDLYHHYPAHRGHVHEIRPGGIIIYDGEITAVQERLGRKDITAYALPALELLEQAMAEAGRPGQARQYQIMKNIVLLGASVGVLQFDWELMAKAIRDGLGRRVADLNLAVARRAYDYAREHFAYDPPEWLHPQPGSPRRILIKGVQAVAIAKLKAGCAIQTYYPISPATDESVYLEEQQGKYTIVVLQTEDEVSAIDSAVLAAHGGVRASTSTAGPGFALMPEGLGLAGITEAPGPVICLYQRGGPSTGLPTRHEQGDLQFALHAGQGDFPRIVLAPGDLPECMTLAFEAFNYADRYQMPVIVMLDKHLATSYVTMEPPDLSSLAIDRGAFYQPDGDGNSHPYLRYQFTPSGVSPRSTPGQEGGIFWTTSDEHDQVGHITEGTANRLAIMEKRMRKLALAAREIPESTKVTLYRRADAPVTVVSWGSNKDVILDTLARMDPEERRLNCLQVRLLCPFPAEQVQRLLANTRTLISVECNYSGQFAALLREQTGLRPHHRLLKYDGRPFSQDEIIAGIEAALAGKDETIVLSEGKVVEPGYGEAEVEALVKLREQSPKMQPSPVPLPPGYNR